MLIDLKQEEKRFENHKAEFHDFGIIKVLDFKNPESNEYRIRFIFEEDYCRLHISGDLGDLVAMNYNNMTFDKFEKDFVNSPGYFASKIQCMNRDIFVYDFDKAQKDLREYIKEFELEEDVYMWYENEKYCCVVDEKDKEESIDLWISEVLADYDCGQKGISKEGYDTATDVSPDFFETADEIGRENTGIIELYMLAFKLAMKQIKNKD